MSAIISTQNLVKRYGNTHALDGLNLEVDQGQVHGFLGPNGAGKSTTLRILLGLAKASNGNATVFGLDPWKDSAQIHQRTAYVPGDVNIWPNLTGGESIDLISRLRGGHGQEYETEKARLAEVFQFQSQVKGRAYSKGNRQKVALIAALAVPAELYIFDEPTSGLDPIMEVAFRQEIARVRERGATVLLSSHILSEVEMLCDRISIIRSGKIVDSGTLAELRHLTRTLVSFAGADAAGARSLPGVADIAVSDGRVSFTIDTVAISSILPALGEMKVEGLQIQPPSLEELFLRHYGDAPASSDSTRQELQ